MNKVTINDYTDLIVFRDTLDDSKRYCFRGQSDSRWDLVPTIYRPLVNVNPPIDKDLDGDWIGQCERDNY